MDNFNGLGMNLGNLSRLSKAKTRSISAENPKGEKGKGAMAKVGEGIASPCARDLGQGWKVNPYVVIEAGKTKELADITGSGAIQSMWFAGTLNRDLILRFYWDGQKQPSVEVPLADFFSCHWVSPSTTSPGQDPAVRITSLPVVVNPNKGLNCYWEMPFRKNCRITLENIGPKDKYTIYYQINYTLTEVPADCAYFHAQFRRVNPLPYKQEYVIVDGIKGSGQYVGTSMGWGINNNGWWGEGEIKFFMDGDLKFPTICGTGTEDYFCGSYNFENQETHRYQTFSTPYAGLAQVLPPDIAYRPGQRFGLYRWHIADPVRFEKNLKVTIQALGWQGPRYLPLQDDIASVAYWYQTEPHAKFPPLPAVNKLVIKPLVIGKPKPEKKAGK